MTLRTLLKLTSFSLIIFCKGYADDQGLNPDLKSQIEQKIQQCNDRLKTFDGKIARFTAPPKPNALNLIATQKWKKNADKLELQKKYYLAVWSQMNSFVNDHKVILRTTTDDRKAAETVSTLIQTCNRLSDSLDNYLKWVWDEKMVSPTDAQYFENAIKHEK